MAAAHGRSSREQRLLNDIRNATAKVATVVHLRTLVSYGTTTSTRSGTRGDMFCSMYMRVTLHNCKHSWSAGSHWLHTCCHHTAKPVGDSAPAAQSNRGAQLDHHLVASTLSFQAGTHHLV